MGQHDIIEIGKGSDNRVFYNGVVDTRFFANGHIGADDGIADITAGRYTYGLDDDRIFKLVFGRNSPAEFFKQFGVRVEQGLFFPAIEPVLHFE